MLEFFIVLTAITWVIRWGVKQQEPQAAEKWAKRWERISPVVKHVRADARAIALNARARRATRKWKL
jgi:uncharacterized iron-regulated membrane protein